MSPSDSRSSSLASEDEHLRAIESALQAGDPELIIAATRAAGCVPDRGSGRREQSCADVLRYVRTSRTARRLNDAAALALCDGVLALSRDASGRLQHDALELAIQIAGKNMARRAVYIREVLRRERSPECDPIEALANELTAPAGPGLAARILAARGCVLVRGLLDPELLKTMKRNADRQLRVYGVRALKAAKVCKPESIIPAEARGFLETMLTPFFHTAAVLRWDHSYLRRVEPRTAATRVPLHQDLNAFGLMLANVWTPLADCGTDAPGLEVVARRTREIVPTMPASNYYQDLEIAESVALARFGVDAFWAPAMACGDVLVMLGTTIHRTYLTRGMTRRRTSLELRFGPVAGSEPAEIRA